MHCKYCEVSLRRDFNLVKAKELYFKSTQEIEQDLNQLINLNYTISCSKCFDYLQHTSANPVGKLHLGNILNALTGNFYSKLSQVKPSFYVNDLGLNFTKFIINWNQDKTIPLQKIYTKSQPTKTQISEKRISLFKNGLSKEEVLLRDQVLNLIVEDLIKFKIDKPKFYYESDYRLKIKQLIDQSQKLEKGYYYKGMQLATSEGAPLYLAGDFCYRTQINKLKSNCLVILGPDHAKYVKEQKKYYSKPWDTIITPIVKIGVDKLSKRLDNNLSLLDLVNELDSTEESVILFLKLYLLKFNNRDTMDINHFLNEYRTNKKLYFKLVERHYSGKEQPLSSERAILWSNLKYMMHNVLIKKDLNRLYKFLERDMELLTENKDPRINSIRSSFLSHLGL